MLTLLKKPSAWIPIAIPLGFIAYMVFVIATAGTIVREPDEGTAAHLFQIWLVLEPFMLGYFAIKYFPLMPHDTTFILALQIFTAFLPIYIVHSLGL